MWIKMPIKSPPSTVLQIWIRLNWARLERQTTTRPVLLLSPTVPFTASRTGKFRSALEHIIKLRIRTNDSDDFIMDFPHKCFQREESVKENVEFSRTLIFPAFPTWEYERVQHFVERVFKVSHEPGPRARYSLIVL